MNCYQVWMEDNGYMFIGAENASKAKVEYIHAATDMREEDAFTEGVGLHCLLIERDVEFRSGNITDKYERSRGVDLMLSGVIDPAWYLGYPADYDDFRDWEGFVKHIDADLLTESVEEEFA